jgi:hypothetical protein
MNPAWPRSPQHGPAPVAPKGLNYHHLLYFWTVAREGSVTAAARRLGLAQSTVSGQLRRLEQRLGHPLFQRQGRTRSSAWAGSCSRSRTAVSEAAQSASPSGSPTVCRS